MALLSLIGWPARFQALPVHGDGIVTADHPQSRLTFLLQRRKAKGPV
jgi:hypothetical protein